MTCIQPGYAGGIAGDLRDCFRYAAISTSALLYPLQRQGQQELESRCTGRGFSEWQQLFVVIYWSVVRADRVDGAATALTTDFFGRPASFPVAPHVLAARSGAPVVMCFGLHEGRNRYRIEFVAFGAEVPRHARGAALQPMVDRYAELLEAFARRYPLNWFNFYPFWADAGRPA